MRPISIVKPTRCTNESNLFYFGITLYMLLASRQQYLFDKCLLLYVQSWTPDDGRKHRPKHVECHSEIKEIWYIGASSWFYYRNNITIHGPMNVILCFCMTSQFKWLNKTGQSEFDSRKGQGYCPPHHGQVDAGYRPNFCSTCSEDTFRSFKVPRA
jgi:hypothetical protein